MRLRTHGMTSPQDPLPKFPQSLMLSTNAATLWRKSDLWALPLRCNIALSRLLPRHYWFGKSDAAASWAQLQCSLRQHAHRRNSQKKHRHSLNAMERHLDWNQSIDAGFTEVRLNQQRRSEKMAYRLVMPLGSLRGSALRSSDAITTDPSKHNNLVHCHVLQWVLGTKVAFSFLKVKCGHLLTTYKRVDLKLILLTEVYSLIYLLVANILRDLHLHKHTCL